MEGLKPVESYNSLGWERPERSSHSNPLTHTRVFQWCGFSPALCWPEMAQGGMSSMDPCVHLHALPKLLNSPQTQTPAVAPSVPLCLPDRRTLREKPGSKPPVGSGDPLPKTARDLGSPCRHCPELGRCCPSCSHLFSLPEFQDYTENCVIPTCGQRFSTAGSHCDPVMRGTSLFRQPSHPHIQTLGTWVLPLWHPQGFHECFAVALMLWIMWVSQWSVHFLRHVESWHLSLSSSLTLST